MQPRKVRICLRFFLEFWKDCIFYCGNPQVSKCKRAGVPPKVGRRAPPRRRERKNRLASLPEPAMPQNGHAAPVVAPSRAQSAVARHRASMAGHRAAGALGSAVAASGVNSGADSGLPGIDKVLCRANRSELILLNFIAREPLETLDRIAALFVST